jgi:predicted Zn-ribbon and HTH transcriptional regulator
MKLTPEQHKAYLENPNKCPYCGSEDISAGEMNADGDSIWVAVKCNGCKKEWSDIYVLTDIYPEE